MSEVRLRDAVSAAEKVVDDEKLELPIDLHELARRHDILIQAKPPSTKGVSGMLIRSGEHFGIAYAKHIQSEGFQRFSIAHEFGHYFLPSHPEHVFRDGKGIHESRAGFGSGDQIELEADHFAAGLLMPSNQFAKLAGKFSDGLDAIIQTATLCKTSLTASAIRYAELTDAAIAVIMSTGSSVDYCFASNAMKRAKGYTHPRKGSVLPRNSLTRVFNQMQDNIVTAKRDDDGTDLMLWFHTEDEIDASEEVIGLGEYGKTLTIITADIPEDDDDD